MFGGLLGKGLFLDRDLEDWTFETWAWLMSELGGMAQIGRTQLVLPTRDFFPPTEAAGHAKAEHVFACVKDAMAMGAWECQLVASERRASHQQVAQFNFVQNRQDPSGTFRVEGNQAIITYAADLTDKPHALVPTLAHELAHYLLRTAKHAPPGGWEAEELATELAVAYAGFGVFAANNAFLFEQHGDAFGQGWRSQRNGYLSERSWALANAIFLALKDDETLWAEADKRLKPTIAEMVRQARKYLKRKPELLAPLREIA